MHRHLGHFRAISQGFAERPLGLVSEQEATHRRVVQDQWRDLPVPAPGLVPDGEKVAGGDFEVSETPMCPGPVVPVDPGRLEFD